MVRNIDESELQLNPGAVEGIHQQLQTVCTAVNSLVRRLDQVSARDSSKPTPRPSTGASGSDRSRLVVDVTSFPSPHPTTLPLAKPSLSLDSLTMGPSSGASSVLGTPKLKPADTTAFQAFDPLSAKGSPSGSGTSELTHR